MIIIYIHANSLPGWKSIVVQWGQYTDGVMMCCSRFYVRDRIDQFKTYLWLMLTPKCHMFYSPQERNAAGLGEAHK